MSFGTSKWSPWIKNEEESIKLIEKAYELGFNFFDTADLYSDGESERVLGKALKKIGAPRGRVVISTKVFFPVFDGGNTIGKKDTDRRNDAINPDLVNRYGLSRKHILDQVDASLERLGVDYIDLYQIHRRDYVSCQTQNSDGLLTTSVPLGHSYGRNNGGFA
jgi:aryl-alcohol dehydrogenase-like predicted oxidoreductase